MANAYAIGRETPNAMPVYGEQEYARYAVDDSPAPYAPANGGYSVVLDEDATPDGTRIGTEPIHDPRQTPDAPKRYWWQRGRDQFERNKDSRDTGLTPEVQEAPGKVALSPYQTQTPPSRWTAALSPLTHTFTRPFTGGTPRRFTGVHTSMADHVRNRTPVEIYTMKPPRQARSTYRLDTVPFGMETVDRPAGIDYVPNATVTVADAGMPASRSFRLG